MTIKKYNYYKIFDYNEFILDWDIGIKTKITNVNNLNYFKNINVSTNVKLEANKLDNFNVVAGLYITDLLIQQKSLCVPTLTKDYAKIKLNLYNYYFANFMYYLELYIKIANILNVKTEFDISVFTVERLLTKHFQFVMLIKEIPTILKHDLLEQEVVDWYHTIKFNFFLKKKLNLTEHRYWVCLNLSSLGSIKKYYKNQILII